MIPQIRILREPDDSAFEWFLEGDMSCIALDTETMGPDWLRLHRQLKATTNPIERKVIEKEMAGPKVSKQALKHRDNLLAVVQLAERNGRCLVILTETEEMKTFVTGILNLLIAKEDRLWLLANAKFDFHQLKTHLGISFEGKPLHDVVTCEALIKGAKDSSPNGLKALCDTYDVPAEFGKIDMSPVCDWWQELTPEQIEYASRDVYSLFYIMDAQKERMKADGLLRVRKLECTLTARLARMEDEGLQFDHAKLHRFMLMAQEKVLELREKVSAVFGETNVNSSQQMLKKIDEVYGLIPTTEKYNAKAGTYETVASVDKFALLESGLMEHQEIKDYVALKEIQKHLKEAAEWVTMDAQYADFFQVATRSEDGTGGAVTGRMSSSPNHQNKTNFMKQFVAHPDPEFVILSSDFKGVELCIMGFYSGNELLQQAATINLHKRMAVSIKSLEGTVVNEDEIHKKSKVYRIAKETNFGFQFGMFPKKFATRVLRATDGAIRLTIEEARNAREVFFNTYPEVAQYHELQLATGCLEGYVTTRSGRRRYYNRSNRPKLDYDTQPFRDPRSGLWIGPSMGDHQLFFGKDKSRTIRCAIGDMLASWRAADWKWRNVCYNTPIQGTGADILKFVLNYCMEHFDERYARVFVNVHDSIDSYVHRSYLDKAISIVDAATAAAQEVYMPHVVLRAEHSYGRCWAAPPVEISTSGHGLWVVPSGATKDEIDSYCNSEFQQEVA